MAGEESPPLNNSLWVSSGMAPKQQDILCREEGLPSGTIPLGDTQADSSPAAFRVPVHEA